MSTPAVAASPEAQERERWLAVRRLAITATDAAAILGLSKYATPLDVCLDKIGELPALEQTDRMEAGNRLQRPIIDWWADRAGVAVLHAPPHTFTRRAGSILGASLDATVRDTGEPVDAKNVGWRTAEWGDEGTDKMPLGFAVQLAVQMHVTGASRAYLPVLFGGNDLVSYVVERDDALEAAIVRTCTEFHERYVLPRVLPPVDGSEAWSEYVKRTFKQKSEKVVRATVEQNEVAQQLALANEALKHAEAEADRLRNELKLAIGEAYALEGPSFKATWGTTKDTMGPNHEQVARDLALKVAALTGEPATQLFADACAANQVVVRKGFRRFTFTFRGN